jgi:SAM-dependent methyltransferase
MKKTFTKRKVGKHLSHRDTWNREYTTSDHLALSSEPSEDLVKAIRWMERASGHRDLNTISTVLDLGCGNGRHLVYLAQTFGMKGIGYDISDEAIRQAREASLQLPLKYEVRSIAGDFDTIRDGSITIALDLMSSHFLRAAEREHLRSEILRVLKPGGFLIFKSFLADEDLHTKRLLREHPADEPGAYTHPIFGLYEYTWTEEGVRTFFEQYFTIHKLDKSHRHIIKGKAGKRRTITAYLQKE